MGTKKITISHQRSGCIGCSSCASLAPQTWQMNHDDGLADLIDGKENKNGMVTGTIDEVDYEANQKAAEACPVSIIKLN
jgi:ferredoxin